MSNLKAFVLARLNEAEEAIKSRDLYLPIHFVGCYYYENTLDANLHCDCDEDGRASTLALADIEGKRHLIEAFSGEEQEMLLAILAKPYSEHPDYSSLA